MVPVPSLFFIGKNGKPVDIISNNITLEELTKRINIVIEQHTGVSPTTSLENTSKLLFAYIYCICTQIILTISAATASQDFIQSERSSQVVTAPTPESTQTVKCENGGCPLVTEVVKSSTSEETNVVEHETVISEISTSDTDKKMLTPEEQVQHAKEIIEEKRKIKEEEEKEVGDLKIILFYLTLQPINI